MPEAGAPGEDPDTAALVERVQARYDAIRDIRADFVQIARVASLGRDERARGSVVVGRPGRMRWEYTEPEPSTLVIDTELVSMYSPGDRKLQLAPLAGAALSPTALGFLLGEGVLAEQFSASRIAAPERAEIGLLLTPRSESGFESLEIWLDATTYQLRESVLVDLFANRTRVLFEQTVENAGLPDDAFALEVPDDTEVIDLRTEGTSRPGLGN